MYIYIYIYIYIYTLPIYIYTHYYMFGLEFGDVHKFKLFLGHFLTYMVNEYSEPENHHLQVR